MNVLIGVNMAYLSFVPNAGNSLMFSIIAITLYTILSVISLILCIKAMANHESDNTNMFRDLVAVQMT